MRTNAPSIDYLTLEVPLLHDTRRYYHEMIHIFLSHEYVPGISRFGYLSGLRQCVAADSILIHESSPDANPTSIPCVWESEYGHYHTFNGNSCVSEFRATFRRRERLVCPLMDCSRAKFLVKDTSSSSLLFGYNVGLSKYVFSPHLMQLMEQVIMLPFWFMTPTDLPYSPKLTMKYREKDDLTSLNSTGGEGMFLATLRTKSTLDVDYRVFSPCRLGAIEICPNEATVSITAGATGKLTVSAFILTLTSISFDGQSVEHSTSLLGISASGSIVVSGCSFYSALNVGDESIFSSSLFSENSITFDYTTFSFSMAASITFESCSSTENDGGWISITSADLVTFLSSSLASLKPSTQTPPYSMLEKKKWYGSDTNGTEGSLLFFWYLHTSTCESTHIHADGEDHTLCGRESLPCSSFNRTLSEGLTIAADAILTSSTSQQTITMTSAASITIDQNSLTLLDLSLIAYLSKMTARSHHSLSQPLSSFTLPTALIIHSPNRSHHSLSQPLSSFTLPTALIDLTAGSLSHTSTKFHQIARSDGNGRVLEVEMVEGIMLEIDDEELCDVTTQNGVANGFFISFTTISDKSKITAFSLHNLKYSNSSSSNSNGAFVLVEGNNLDQWIAYDDPRFTGSFETGVSFEWLWSIELTTTLNTSLLFYLIAGSGGIGVASDGLDLEKCGDNSVWCRTLEHSLTRASEVPKNQLHVMGEVSVGNEVEMEGVTVKGLPVMSSIVLSSSGCLREETGDTIQFESVTIVLKEGGRSSAALVVLFGHMNRSMVEISVLADQTTPLFKSVNSILTLQTITISSSHHVGTLMDCEKGTVSVNSLVSANISFSSTPIRLSDLRSARLVQLQVSNTSDLVFMECSNITALSLQSCSFEGPVIPTQASHNEHESLCEWTTGVITIVDSTPLLRACSFVCHVVKRIRSCGMEIESNERVENRRHVVIVIIFTQ
ncbi:hypothetical protein BLNAU_22821 [Blattamonas nauphoetae]|uniref:Uncharacterized protein n=1 Tax=Blattamonas nauphoetae TaxID=2049346 RepID=A0ABQ9WU49_9EUKA|nr:hypothetical protein BLNAU_22821 [Blattamonas nauphoetae]